ncbi:MAG: response regulator transcription factor [Chthoniobacteraceae bacterium]
MRILVAEDEKKIARLIRKGLAEQGYAVDVCHRGDEALEMGSTQPYDAIILDIMLPGRDGLSVLRVLRDKKIVTPVMFLTARGEVSERVEGLNLGADDYLAKPFAMDELLARLRALLRRASGEKLSFYKIGDLTTNLVSREVTRGARKIELTTREFNLLEYFMRTPGQVFTRTQIHERVWEYHFDPGTNLVDVYIQRLRRKIDDGEPVKLIQTVRGVGYCVKLPD